MNIITGYRGEPHITSGQDRDGNQGSYGTGSYILNVGDKMAASIVSANEIRISDGILSHQGCLGNIEKGMYESLAIDNGAQGTKRSDLIVCRYEKNIETNVESLSLIVIKGTPAETNPADPTYVTGDIQTGDSPVDMPLYRVNIDGIIISSVTRLASYVRTQAEMDSLLGTTSISGIGGGTVTGAISSVNSTLSSLTTKLNVFECVRTGTITVNGATNVTVGKGGQVYFLITQNDGMALVTGFGSVTRVHTICQGQGSLFSFSSSAAGTVTITFTGTAADLKYALYRLI